MTHDVAHAILHRLKHGDNSGDALLASSYQVDTSAIGMLMWAWQTAGMCVRAFVHACVSGGEGEGEASD